MPPFPPPSLYARVIFFPPHVHAFVAVQRISFDNPGSEQPPRSTGVRGPGTWPLPAAVCRMLVVASMHLLTFLYVKARSMPTGKGDSLHQPRSSLARMYLPMSLPPIPLSTSSFDEREKLSANRYGNARLTSVFGVPSFIRTNESPFIAVLTAFYLARWVTGRKRILTNSWTCPSSLLFLMVNAEPSSEKKVPSFVHDVYISDITLLSRFFLLPFRWEPNPIPNRPSPPRRINRADRTLLCPRLRRCRLSCTMLLHIPLYVLRLDSHICLSSIVRSHKLNILFDKRSPRRNQTAADDFR